MKDKTESPGVSPETAGAKNNLREILSFFRTLSIFIIIAVFLRASIVEAFKIPSGSMKPTLLIGDHILVSKFNYGIRIPFKRKVIFRHGIPKRGDIVVFTRPDLENTSKDESSINIIKRVIGLPGETVEVRNTKVFINGQFYQEPYAVWDWGGIRNFGPAKVPDNHVFLLGDNRDHSKDGRFWTDNHYLDIDRIKGKALMVYWNINHPIKRFGKIIK